MLLRSHDPTCALLGPITLILPTLEMRAKPSFLHSYLRGSSGQSTVLAKIRRPLQSNPLSQIFPDTVTWIQPSPPAHILSPNRLSQQVYPRLQGIVGSPEGHELCPLYVGICKDELPGPMMKRPWPLPRPSSLFPYLCLPLWGVCWVLAWYHIFPAV